MHEFHSPKELTGKKTTVRIRIIVGFFSINCIYWNRIFVRCTGIFVFVCAQPRAEEKQDGIKMCRSSATSERSGNHVDGDAISKKRDTCAIQNDKNAHIKQLSFM